MQRDKVNNSDESWTAKEPSTSDLKSHEVARRFLTIMHQKCPGQLELRVIDPKTGSCRQFCPTSVEQAVTVAIRESRKVNVYLGVATRLDQSSGKKSNVSHYPGVWVDVDFKDFEGGEEDAREKLDAFPLKPTIIVHSGGGFHLYFLLKEPVTITPDSLPELEALNKAFAKALGGDRCYSIDHIMRIPGTTNWPDEKKRKRGRIPVPVRLLSHVGPRYTLQDLQAAIANSGQSKDTSERNHSKGAVKSLPTRFFELLKHNPKIKATWEGKRKDLKDQSGSGYDLALTNQLTQHGFTDDETKAILRLMPSGRGAKAKDAYQTLTIHKAQVASSQGRFLAANLADRFLLDRQLSSQDGLRLRWYQQGWLLYNGKAYDPLPLPELQADVTKYLQSTHARHKATTQFVNNVLLNLQARCLVPSSVSLPAYESEKGWIKSPNTLVLSNGAVDLHRLFNDPKTNALENHTPQLISTIVLPFEFDPIATCPHWLVFLEEILPDVQCRLLLREIFGYCLTYDVSQQKLFMFEGNGANGKGVVTGVQTRLLGEANISSIPLELFAASHGLEVTLGKLVNIVSEVGDLDRVAEGLLKQFTGGDTMHFNPKYKHPFPAKPTAKLIVSTNVRPPFRDRSEGIWRRLILLPFPVTIPEEKQNKHLVEDLAVELPGIFNWAVSGYKSLLARGHFVEPAICRTTKLEFRRECNPAGAFLQEHCVADPKVATPTADLYFEYAIFCKGHGYKSLNDANFGKEVRRAFPMVRRNRIRLRNSLNRPWAYIGVRLVDGIKTIRLSQQS